VGLQAATIMDGDEIINLLRAYQSLRLPIRGPPFPSLQGYNADQARESLLDPSHRTPPTTLELDIVTELMATDDDHLHFTTINPDFNQSRFDENSILLTRQGRHALRLEATEPLIEVGPPVPILLSFITPEDAVPDASTPSSSASTSLPASSSSEHPSSGPEQYHRRSTSRSQHWSDSSRGPR
jgi:hypothetical protein